MAHGSAIWLPFVQPFGTVLLGVGAAFIAYRQWRTANNKVRLDLFDKRIGNFNSFMHLFDRYRNSGGLDKSGRDSLSSVILASGLLFGSDMNQLLAEALKCVDKAQILSQDRSNSELYLKMRAEVDRLQFKMRDVLQSYAGMSKVR